jgi:hypothetical protein
MAEWSIEYHSSQSHIYIHVLSTKLPERRPFFHKDRVESRVLSRVYNLTTRLFS